MKNVANGENAANAGEISSAGVPAKSVSAGTGELPETLTSTGEPAGTSVSTGAPVRRRLRMQPLAQDPFMTFVYACIIALLVFEFVALFWLDLFDFN